MFERFVTGLAILAMALVSEAADDTDRLAAQIVYRLEAELGSVDAAQRHMVIARLLIATETGALVPDVSLADLGLEWEQEIERRETLVAHEAIPLWSGVSPVNGLDLYLDLAVPDMVPLVFSDPLWDRQRAHAAVIAISDGEEPLATLAYRGAVSWSHQSALMLWQAFLRRVDDRPELKPLVAPLVEPWLALPLSATVDEWEQLRDDAGAELRALKTGAKTYSPAAMLREEVDRLLSESLLINGRLSPLEGPGRRAYFAAFLAHNLSVTDRALANLIDAVSRLDQGDYVGVVGSLLEVAIALTSEPGRGADIAAALAELDRLDPQLLAAFNRVDSRLVAIYQQARGTIRGLVQQPEVRAAEDVFWQIANLASILYMDTQGLEGYLAQPTRESLTSELLVCLGMSRDRTALPIEPISDEQYRGCLQAFESWAGEQAVSPELAGAANGPFGMDQLLRETRLSPWQRINYWIGYLAELSDGACRVSGLPVVNPLEYGIAARALVRFVRHWPQYADAQTVQTLQRIQGVGQNLITALDVTQRCASAQQPLAGALSAYGDSLAMLDAGLTAARSEFLAANLAPGADVDLTLDASQTTSFRPEDVTVGPCDAESACGVDLQLPGSRGLYSLFPEEYLLAHQTHLGTIELCYSQVEWVERRAELPRGRPKAMADYYGRMAFVLEGRYSGLDEPIFRRRLVGGNEHQYLFGANNEQVLNDPCPRDRLDRQVHAELPERRFNLVPRRLTFMTAERTSPSKLFERNWESEEQWRDAMLTGQSQILIAPASEPQITEQLSDHLATLYQRLNEESYQSMLNRNRLAEDNGDADLAEILGQLDTHKRALAAIATILAPYRLAHNIQLRAAVHGEYGLLDRAAVLRFRQEGKPIREIGATASERFNRAQQVWIGAMTGEPAQTDPLIVATFLDLAAAHAETSAVVRSARLRPEPEGR